ncbi:MAG: hypothetical protein RI953_381 [Pseudomonadota bacterium]|jgi:glutamate synthase (NADPH/NADH) small chain
MADPRGFLKYSRVDLKKEDPEERIKHSNEFTAKYSTESLSNQAQRCMDCGVAFCHRGCPLGNLVPEWNRAAAEGHFQSALELLLATNNFPEFTGRVCPAPCESACVLGINSQPVSIENIEMTLADMGFENGWIKAEPPTTRSGRKVAIVGSGPTGLAAAQQLNRLGHSVVVFERAENPGGLLRYGIPDFKLAKEKVERRVQLLRDEGIEFVCRTQVGVDISLDQIRAEHEAVLLACGSSRERDLHIAGRHLSGVHFAHAYLSQATRRLEGQSIPESEQICAKGKNVVVIGGGDTGSDCVGTALRQGAKSVVQFEILPQPPDLGPMPTRDQRPQSSPWPEWPHILRTSTSQEEGGERHWQVESTAFEGNEQGLLTSIRTRSRSISPDSECTEGKLQDWPCDLALIACGFIGPDNGDELGAAGIALNERGQIDANPRDYKTSQPGVFAAGDMRRGQSLVVWAIAEGRQAASAIHRFLQANKPQDLRKNMYSDRPVTPASID